MSIEKIKGKMKKYRDLYGGDLLGVYNIDKANTKEELAAIIEEHRTHMEMMLADANSHLDRFKGEMGLRTYQLQSTNP